NPCYRIGDDPVPPACKAIATSEGPSSLPIRWLPEGSRHQRSGRRCRTMRRGCGGGAPASAIQPHIFSTDTARERTGTPPRLRAPIEVDRQEGHIGRRDPADAKGLTQAARGERAELLLRLITQAGHLRVVRLRRDQL